MVYGIPSSMFVTVTVLAFLIAKVVLIVDHVPFVNRFPEKPLIYNVLWKTAFYQVATLEVRAIRVG